MVEDMEFRIEDVGYIIPWRDIVADVEQAQTLLRNLTDTTPGRAIYKGPRTDSLYCLYNLAPEVRLIPDLERQMGGEDQIWTENISRFLDPPGMRKLDDGEMNMLYEHHKESIPHLFSDRDRSRIILPMFLNRAA